ncbi:hypothetical protein HOLleu_36897 [Holothuria leucospilota]|uniref:Uncharacterized protein n=1 Tax=Holothuria leucospilota TaxID=206669 RepID=A0A9Q1BGY1_HOLLE|nr:hypothetical protein HOLleu_36897 [Holothuria leucospilota]
MTLKAFVKLTVFNFALLGISQIDGRTVKLAHRAWKGVVGYIAVERKAVQDKLDYYNAHLSPFGGPLLFLPRTPVFPDILNETQHVLYVDSGNITVIKCEPGVPKCCPSVTKPISATSIPLLTDDPDGTPKYSLGLNIFYSKYSIDVRNDNPLFLTPQLTALR